MMGQQFKRLGVPVVIAVNQQTPIQDKVCQIFSAHFYQSLVAGGTPKEAFDAGKNAVKASKTRGFSCCCAHNHKTWCKWNTFKIHKGDIGKDKDAAHNAHTPNCDEIDCSCESNSNIHQNSCKFQERFINQFLPQNILESKSLSGEKLDNLINKYKVSMKDWEQDEQHKKVCCCSPDITHDETQKFIILQRDYMQRIDKLKGSQKDESSSNNEGLVFKPQYMTEQEIKYFEDEEKRILNTKIFEGRQKGELDVKGNIDQKNQLKSTVDPNMLIGRSKYIQEILQYLDDSKPGCSRLLHIHGSEGHGKCDIANFAGVYALQGRVQLDGALYIEVEGKESVNGLKFKMYKRLSEKIIMPEYKDEYGTEIILRVIREKKYMIILDKCSNLIEKDKEEFNTFLKDLVECTNQNKIIVITLHIEDITINSYYKTTLHIQELNRIQAAKLFLKCAKESNHLKDFKNVQEFSKHEIFKIVPLNPQMIVRVAQVLRDKSLQEIVDEKVAEQNKYQKEEELKSQSKNQRIDLAKVFIPRALTLRTLAFSRNWISKTSLKHMILKKSLMNTNCFTSSTFCPTVYLKKILNTFAKSIKQIVNGNNSLEKSPMNRIMKPLDVLFQKIKIKILIFIKTIQIIWSVKVLDYQISQHSMKSLWNFIIPQFLQSGNL